MLPLAAIAVGLVSVVVLTRRTWDKELLPPTQGVLTFPPVSAGRPARHPRLELEFHAHRHWGWKRISFVNGLGAGWSLHLGFGAGCLCVDFYRRGRRP
jgi:hypothetical protein